MLIPETNTLAAFEAWAKEIASSTGFELGEKLYHGTYYSTDYIRDAIYSGSWEGKSAVLKLYDDPRLSDEPLALEAFHRNNKSEILSAPALYKFQIVSPRRGWLIMERLPLGGTFLKSPLSHEDRVKFLELYLEYRTHFSTRPTRALLLAEHLPAAEFHRTRIAQWFRLAQDREVDRRALGHAPLLQPEEFMLRYLKALDIISREFVGRKMILCHGHFKPPELYRTADGKYYLTDFAHVKMYPEGYELAFIVWADRLMLADWHQSYADWKEGIEDWTKIFRARQASFGFAHFARLWRASLLERCLGTVLADIAASDRPREEQENRIVYLYRLIDELCEDYGNET